MSLFDDPPLRDFPDRAIRRLLADWQNLRDLISDVAGELAANMDFQQAEPVERQFLLEDWRRRESDLLFRVPFRSPVGVPPALVCVLIEHQTSPDPPMPLRMLLYAVLYWEREWKSWEEAHARGQPLRLTPVLPVVFHTGWEAWRTHRELADLLAAPDEMAPFAPRWPMLFWELPQHSTESLLRSTSAWLRSLAVVRAEQEDAEAFANVFAEVLGRLEPLHHSEAMRCKDLLWFVISWALRRRPPVEKNRLAEVAKASQSSVDYQKEVEAMTRTIGQTWEELERIKVADAALRTRKDDLRALLERRFGRLPDALLQKIESATDVARLKDCILQVLEIGTLDELDLGPWTP